jgi:hypothetical protein
MLSTRLPLHKHSAKFTSHRRVHPKRCYVTGSSSEFSRGAAQFQRTASKRAQDFQKSAQDFVTDTGKKVSDIIEEQNLSDKAQKAASTAQNKFQDLYAEVQVRTSSQVSSRQPPCTALCSATPNLFLLWRITAHATQDNARRTYWKLDSEYRINDKARKARRRVEQAAADVDQQYSFKSRVRSIREDVQRKWPTWQRQAQEFFATTPGKLVLAIGVGLLFSTGLIWSLLNLLLVLWWLSVPLSLFSLSVAQRQQKEAYKKAAQQQAKQQQGWAGFPGFGRQAGGQQGGGMGQQAGGPVIDAEYTVVSDDKKQKR